MSDTAEGRSSYVEEPGMGAIILRPTSTEKEVNVVQQEIDNEDDTFSSSSNPVLADQTTNSNQKISQPTTSSESPRFHMSQRFGPVAIKPPIGHSYFCKIIQDSGFVLTLPKNHLCKKFLSLFLFCLILISITK